MKKIKVQVINKTTSITPYISAKLCDISVFTDATSAFVSVSEQQPDVIILEYTVRGNKTAEFIALLNKASPGSKVVLIADHITEEQVIDCFLAGVRGYLPVKEMERFINKCIQVIDKGETWISRKMVGQRCLPRKTDARTGSLR